MNPRPTLLFASILLLSFPVHVSASDWGISGVPIATGPGERTTANLWRSGVAAIDAAGGAFVAWKDSRTEPSRIFVQRVTASGSPAGGWPASGLAITPAVAVAQSSPALTHGLTGGAFVSWIEGSTDSILARVRLTRLDSDGSPAPGWPASGVVLGVQANPYSPTTVVSDFSDGVFVMSMTGTVGTTPLQIRLHHVLANGSIGTPSEGLIVGQSFAFPTPAMVSDNAGGVLLVWDEYRGILEPPFSVTDYRAQHFLEDGSLAPGWNPDGILVQSTGTPLTTWRAPSIGSDGIGGAVVAFREAKPGESNYQVYARHILSSGEFDPDWPAGGAPATSTQLGVGDFHMVPDFAGGALVVFMSFELGSPQMRIQHWGLNGSIAPGWPADGRVLSHPGAYADHPLTNYDGQSGAFVVWTERRDGVERLNIHHVLPNGADYPGWGPHGVEIAPGSPDEYNQDGLSLVFDWPDGVFAFWSDYRIPPLGDSFRILGQHIVGAPTADVPEPPAPEVGRLSVHPNPAFASATVRLRLPSAADVSIEILDVNGRRVRRLADHSSQAAGEPAWSWNLLDDQGQRVRPGVYRVVTRRDGEVTTAPVVVMR
ncbi:MAG TPA: FlgD immunoglobulin-like domain containing protein [Candidatus Eisenbacteria bacterium]|nr:FlgD immunoglobulin-like domain containing protein [Candidatus Eisenbacteria bacterium]